MIFVKDMNQFLPPVTVDPNTPKVRPTLASKILPAVNLLLTDPKMVLLYPAQLSFAFMATFLNSYSNRHIVKVRKSVPNQLGGLKELGIGGRAFKKSTESSRFGFTAGSPQ